MLAPSKFITAIFLLVACSKMYATTWDEPWQDKVITQSESFVYANILECDEEKSVTIEIIKTLAGKELKGKIKITDFYLLDLCSMSGGHGPEFRFPIGGDGYFFIKKKKGKYCVATPTSGFAKTKDGKVYATYRHSYHQALVTTDVYEKTMTAIFNHYHGQQYNKEDITTFVDEYLALAPAGFKENEIATFFNQHAALECIFHLKLEGYYDKIIPFLNDTSNFHSQVSAARALVVYNTEESKKSLMNLINSKDVSDFVKIMAIQSLFELKPTELKLQLEKMLETASTENVDFGGNIMDPRVCTNLGDVKKNLEKLIAIL